MRLSNSRVQLNARRTLRLALLGSLLMTGCNGQKYNLPSFSWKATNASTKTAEAKPQESKSPPSTAATGLSNVALNDPVPFDSDDTLAEAGVIPASGQQPEQSGILSRQTERDIDEAFRPRSPHGSGERQSTSRAADISPYENVVSAVDQGESHLSALKQSLQGLNDLNSPTETDHSNVDTVRSPAGTRTSPSGEAPAYPAEMGWANNATTSSATDDVGRVHLGTLSSGLDSQEFPWAVSPHVSQQSPGLSGVAGVDYSLDRARQLLVKSKTLLQQNNFFAAFDVARSAQSLLQKTQAALLPGEVTPEQILAEIAERQLQHERQLAEARQPKTSESGRNMPAVEVRPDGESLAEILPVPVKIDLSTDTINLGRRQQKSPPNDIVQFEEAVVLSNQAAQLPSINPGTSLTNPVPPRDSHQVARLETNPAAEAETAHVSNRPLSLPKTSSESSDGDSTEVRLMAGETGETLTSTLPGEFSLTLGPLPTFSGGDSPLADSQTGGPRMVSENSRQDAPLLIAPQGSQSSEADLDDIFAADFADVTAASSTALEEASLLIDEADLQWEPDQKPFLTGNNLTLVLCGLAVGLVLLFRWRR